MESETAELVPYRVRCPNLVTGPQAIRVADQDVVKGVEDFMAVGKYSVIDEVFQEFDQI